MKTTLFIILLSLTLSFVVYSQETEKSAGSFQKLNSINLEAGGFGFFGSLEYERILANSERNKTTGRIGISPICVPVMLNQLFSFNRHHIEFGLALLFPSFFEGDVYFSGQISYRFQKPDGRSIFRAGLMPVVLGPDSEAGPDMILWAWPGISWGWAF